MQPDHGPGQGASGRAPQVGLAERDPHSGPCDLEVGFGSGDLLGGRSLSKPCLSPGARRALSLSLSLWPTSSVDEIAGRGCFTHLAPGSSSALEAPLPCRSLPRRAHRRFHPPTRASPESTPTGHLGLRSGSFACHLHTFACAVIPGLLPRPGPADAGSVLSPEPDLTA